MGISVADNFDHKSKKPLDARTSYSTLALMKAVTDANINEGCLAYCAETDKYYKFLSTNTSDSTTGKWREFETGGGEDVNAYHTGDTAFTAIDDADYVPVYDSSATASKKSLWSNIKSVLKTYFDTLYSTTKTRGTPASGGTTLSLVNTGDMYNWNTDMSWYATSSTGASTTAKTCTTSRGTFTLVAGAKVTVKFTYTNTASAPTLSVNSSTSKSIKVIDVTGSVVTPTVWWRAGDIVSFIYDGTQFIMQPSSSTGLYKVLTATLAVNATSLTFSGIPASGDYILTLACEDPSRMYINAVKSGTSITYYFNADSSKADTFYLKIEGA